MRRSDIRFVEYTKEQSGTKDILLLYRPKESVSKCVEKWVVEKVMGRRSERKDMENNTKPL